MSLPSRSRSLRQPGFARREMIDGAQRATTTSIEKHNEPAREWRSSESAITKPGERPQTSLTTGMINGNEPETRHRQELSSSQRINGPYTQTPKRPLNDYQNGTRRGEDGIVSAITPASGYKNSSGLPLPSQLSRSSSTRQPADYVGHGMAVKNLQSRNSSIEGRSTDGSELRPVPTPARSQAWAERRLHPQSIPLLSRVSAASRPVVGHSRSNSNGTTMERGSEKYHVSGQKRLSSVEKPQFSTYQQTFSAPKPKPPNETTKAAQGVPSTSTEATYLAGLQSELLQLQWVHISSQSTLQSWMESGERAISEQSKKQAEAAWKVQRLEQDQQNCINAATIRDWLSMDKGGTSFEKVETLSRCIQTLTSLGQPHAKLSAVIEEFEAWYQDMMDTVRERLDDDCEWTSPRCLQPLPAPWAENVAMLILSLGTCRRSLEALRSDHDNNGDGSSGLDLVLDAHTRLAEGMVEELSTMKRVHGMVLAREDDWIQDRITSALLQNPNERSASSPCSHTRSAAWHRAV